MNKMKLTAALVALFAASPALAQDGFQRWIDVVNRTNVTLERFYATDVGTNSWGPDLLGDGVIPPGRQQRLEPTRGQQRRGFCRFDIRVTFANGEAVERRGVNLCEATAFVCTSTRSCGVR